MREKLAKLNNSVVDFQGTVFEIVEIKDKYDTGYLLKDVKINGEIITDHCWVYKSDILRLKEVNIEIGKRYNFKGLIGRYDKFNKEGKLISNYAFMNITKINNYLEKIVKPKEIKEYKELKKDLKHCPICKSLEITSIGHNYNYCFTCFNEFK